MIKTFRRAYFVLSGFWLLMAAINTGQYVLSNILKNQTVDWGGLLLWSAGWLVWAALTPLVMNWARRFPIGREKIFLRLILHFAAGIMAALAVFAAEFLISYVVRVVSSESSPPLISFLGIFTYKFHVNLLIYWAIVGITHAVDFYLQKAELQSALSKAQLSALRMQLQPHFLFNTHHAITALVLKKENDAAIQMLTRLSDLLRLTLETPQANEVPLKKEMEFINLYLDIQNVRFANRLQVQRDIDPKSWDALVPNWILQPLVENALQHAFSVSSDSGVLTIQSRCDHRNLMLTITDDGPGFPESINEGIGLSNTRARLQQLYGQDARLTLQNLNGASASIQLPLHYETTSNPIGR
ncbi:histidine kinase [bacterium]|nr:histidine kinase [bacterium]